MRANSTIMNLQKILGKSSTRIDEHPDPVIDLGGRGKALVAGSQKNGAELDC